MKKERKKSDEERETITKTITITRKEKSGWSLCSVLYQVPAFGTEANSVDLEQMSLPQRTQIRFCHVSQQQLKKDTKNVNKSPKNFLRKKGFNLYKGLTSL